MVVFSSNGLDVCITVSQETRFTCHRRVRVLRTMKGARAPLFQRWRWTLVFRLVASLGKYAFTIQNACLFVDCSIENGINSSGEVENSNISFRRGLS